MTYDEYLNLCSYLNTLCIPYYEEGVSVIPDHTYDLLLSKVLEFEKNNPEKISKSSPTQRVGGLKKDVPTVTFMHPMQSIQNKLDTEALREWLAAIREKVGKVTYVLEPKYDGLAANVQYIATENDTAIAVQAATRGDGLVGENITLNFFLTNVVREIPTATDVNVRGEIMLSLPGLAAINRARSKDKAPYDNPRNAISGIMRRKQLDAVTASHILFFPYEIVGSEYNHLDRSEKIALLQKWFNQPVTSFICSDNPDEIIKTIEAMGEQLADLDIECDGVVVKVNEADKCAQLGVRSNSPRWAVAYKFPPKKAQTIILNVRWQVGRTGEIAPVADIAPVQLGGVIVAKALIHNLDVISTNDWRIGDTVEVWRGGEVIPRLGAVDLTKRPEHSQPLDVPDSCPCCGHQLERVGAKVYCLNTYGCSDQLKYTYDYIFSRKVFDVEGLSDKTISQIVQKLPVFNPADFFKLTYEDFLKLEGFKDKSASSLVKALEKARTQPLAKVLCALSIFGVAVQTCSSIANYLINSSRNIHDFFKLTDEEFLSIKDVGDVTVKNIRLCFNDSAWMLNAMALIEQLKITYDRSSGAVYRDNITGKRIVITGRFPDSRAHMTATLQLHGAIVTSAVSSKTDYLIAGSEPSAGDLAKAAQHNVTVLNFDQYKALFLN